MIRYGTLRLKNKIFPVTEEGQLDISVTWLFETCHTSYTYTCCG